MDRRIADYIIDIPIPDGKIENAIESLRYEENVQIKNIKKGCAGDISILPLFGP